MTQKLDASNTAPHIAPVEGATGGVQRDAEAEAAQRALFVSMALEMSWQLAVVVIVPIVGGYMLDEHFHSTPWITLSGLVVAMAGVIGVLVRIVREADRRSARVSSRKDAA